MRRRSSFEMARKQHGHVSNTIVLQPALRVGAADDPLEREAERNAERIVSMSAPELATAPPVAISPAGNDAQPDARRSAENQPSLDQLDPNPQLPSEQQEVEVPKTQDVAVDSFASDDLQELESEKPIDPTSEIATSRTDVPMTVGPEGGAAPADVTDHVEQRQGGRPLPDDIRGFMEPRFDADFSGVRIHDGAEDRRAAHRIGARAFTLGEHIWFGEGETPTDKKLVAHELTHVVQQKGRRSREAKPSASSRWSIRRIDWSLPELPSLPSLADIKETAEGFADDVLGYPLIKVILGKSPITGKTVKMTAENLINGLMSLLPGGDRLFDRLQEANIVTEAFNWVKDQLNKLDLTWSRAMRIVDDIVGLFPTLSPFEGIKRILKPIVDDIITFAGNVKTKVLEFIVRGALKLAGSLGDKVWGIFQQAREAIGLILEDPIGFAKNLFSAIKAGFLKFKDNIGEHLKRGLLGWLFGALNSLNLDLPDKLDFKGLMSIVLQVIGLSYKTFRAMLVKKLGSKGERTVALIEKSVEIVKILLKDGLLGIWQKLLGMIDDFKTTVTEGIRNMVIETAIKALGGWLAGLSNPVGAVVKVIMTIYNLIEAFLQRLEDFKQLVSSIFGTVYNIAKGQVADAASFIEKTLSGLVPVVISFLAAFFGLNSIPKRIQGIIEKLQKPGKKALDKLTTFIVKKAKLIISKLVGKLNKKRKLPGTTFNVGKTPHQLYAEKKGNKVEIYVESKKDTTDAASKENKKELAVFKNKTEGEELKAVEACASTFDEETNEVESDGDKVKLTSESQLQRKNIEELERQFAEAQKDLNACAQSLDGLAHVDTENPDVLFRFKEARDAEVEGFAGTYTEVKAKTTQNNPDGDRHSSFYEADHIIEKQFPKEIQRNLDALNGSGQGAQAANTIVRDTTGSASAASAADEVSFGEIKKDPPIGKKATTFPAIAVHRIIHDKKAQPEQSPANMIKAALADADPKEKLKKLLSAEIASEVSSIKTLYQGDTSAPDEVRKNVDKGMKTIADLNRGIFHLQGKTLNKGPAKDPEQFNASELTFAPKEGESRDNLQDIEGVGGTHNDRSSATRSSKLGKWLENDHLIDKSFPKAVQFKKFFNAEIKDKVLGHIPQSTDPTVQANTKWLGNQSIFPFGHEMKKYTEKEGYSISVYKVVHDKTRPGLPGIQSNELLSKVAADKFAPASDVVAAKDETTRKAKLTELRSKISEDLKLKFTERTLLHSSLLTREYTKEVQKVKTINQGKSGHGPMMQKVVGNLNESLTTARSKMDKLFN